MVVGGGRERRKEGQKGKDSQTVTKILTDCLLSILHSQLPGRCTSLPQHVRKRANYTWLKVTHKESGQIHVLSSQRMIRYT